MRFVLILLFTLLLPAAVLADALQDGLNAEQHKDYKTALKLIKPLADQGNANAEFEMGWLCEFGKGLPQDYTAAMSWFKKSAAQGQIRAQQNIGVMYAAGQGVTPDYVEAVFWEALAAKPAAGAPWPPANNDDGLVQKLSPEQIAAVKKRLADWKPVVVVPNATAVPKINKQGQ